MKTASTQPSAPHEGNTPPVADLPPWSPEEFHRQLLARRNAYHVEHPFQIMMTEGRLSREQMRGWVANRFCYQAAIPRKDAAILANCPDREVRRVWVQRILDHDGPPGTSGAEGGGLEAWIALGEACGLSREELVQERHVLPAVRFAVDAYVNFARTAPWQEAVCASLTELFARDAHLSRLASFPVHYPWIPPEGLRYFRNRLDQTRRDVDHGLTLTLAHFNTRALQHRALEILQFKLDILWAMLDAIHGEHVVRGRSPT